MPAAVGLNLDELGQEPQPLTCLDGTRLIGPNGQPVVLHNGDLRTYRIAAISPQTGTPIGRYDPVTVHLVYVDAQEPPAYHPCDWVSTTEAAGLLGGTPVRTASLPHDKAGTTDIACDYSVEGHSSIESRLRMTAAHVVDAATEFDFVTSTAKDSPSLTSSSVSGVGIKAACTTYSTMKRDDDHRLYVLLPDQRIYIATGDDDVPCGTLTQFAQAAIPRIST